MSKAKERQQLIFSFMKNEIKIKGYPPTVREICSALGIKSTSTVHKDLDTLTKEGFIRKDPAKPRALVIIEEEKEEASTNFFNTSNNFSEFSSEIVELPLIGDIAAGTPILAEETISDVFPVPARYLGSGTNFMLKVRGDSMMEVGIYDGDLILVEENKFVNNGDIVVAIIQNFESEATVKTYYKESDGRIRLQPENSSMRPMYFDEVEIVGKVRGVFRFF